MTLPLALHLCFGLRIDCGKVSRGDLRCGRLPAVVGCLLPVGHFAG